MKLLALALLLAFAANPASAASASLTGKWKVHNSVAGNETDQDCTFTQTDKDLAGICTVEQGTVQVTGKIGDASITWLFKTE